MNKNAVARELLRVAKELMAGSSARPIAVAEGYYTNSALDMAQYEETRSIDVTISLDGAGMLTGEAQFETQRIGKLDRWKETEIFGDISRVPAAKIDLWTKNQFRAQRVEYKANQWKSGVGAGSYGRGGHSLKKLLSKVRQDEEETVDTLLDPLDKIDMAVLLATKSFKPQYAGDPDLRKTEIRRVLKFTSDQVDKSRAKLIRLGYMRRNKAISPKGQDAVQAIGELLGSSMPNLSNLRRNL